MPTYRITGALNVFSKSGRWSGGESGAWLLESDADLVAGVNNATGTTLILACGSLIGAEDATGTHRIGFGFNYVDEIIELNGVGPLVSYAGKPTGFRPTSATLKIKGVSTAVPTTEVTMQFFKNGTGTAQFEQVTPWVDNGTFKTFAYDSTPLPFPSMFDIMGQGFGVKLVTTDASANAMFFDAEISGNYVIATWWFNSATNHYQFDENDPGAGWDDADPDPTPVITSVTRYSTYTDGVGSLLVAPATGCVSTPITIVGTGFGDGATVTVGGVAATSVVVVDSTTITAVVGAHADGAVDVVVVNLDGQAATSTGGFTYLTPWWRRAITTITDGVEVTEYALVNQCAAPGTDIWVITSTPEYPTDPDGWFVSSAAYTGDVWVEIDNGPPTYARKWSQISAWATGDAGMLGGSPAASCVYRNRLLYPGGNYTVGTDYPPIRVCNGVFDHEVCRLPPTTSDTIPKAVLSMLAANGTVYLSTFDSGTSSADWRGRVFSLDLDSGVLTPLGAQFAAGEMPYALAWHMGRLWCGTNNGIGTVGKVYYLRPGIDTTWTEDYATSSSTAGGVDSLCSYKGKLYVGTDNAAAARGKVLVRDSSGAYTTSLTGTGGTAVVNNGYLALIEFEGNLYASYWNNDGTPISKIEKFDGSSWSTAYTGASGTLRPFIILLNDNGVLYAAGGGKLLSAAVVTTADGTTWTDRTANLPESNRTLLPMTGVLVI